MIFLNCLAKDIANAKAVMEASDGKAYIAFTTKNYKNVAQAVAAAKVWSKELDGKISVGLGAADPKMCYAVDEVAAQVYAAHANQVFTMAARTKARSLNRQIACNALVSPSGTAGTVLISTGPLSSLAPPAEVAVETAIAMIKEAGVESVKFYNMKSLASDEEFRALARGVAQNGMMLEPTGGLSVGNLEKYVVIAKEEGVKRLMPHLYTSLVEKTTGQTDIALVKQVWEILNRHYDDG